MKDYMSDEEWDSFVRQECERVLAILTEMEKRTIAKEDKKVIRKHIREFKRSMS